MHKLPEGWRRATLAEVAEVRSGFAKNAVHGTKDSAVAVPYLRAANVQDGYLDILEIKSVRVPREFLSRFRLEPGDVLIVEGSGSAEKVGCGHIWSGEIPECIHQNHIFAVRSNRQIIDPHYLNHSIALRSKSHFRALSGKSTTLCSISSAQLKSLLIDFPPIPEQRGITRVIRCADESLSKLMQCLDRKKYLLRGLMQQLLTGQRRFKEFAGKPWREVRLGDVFDERVEINRMDLPLLSITGDRGVIPRDEIERKDSSSADKSKYLRIAPGDIGYNTMRMWQGVSALSNLEGIVSPAYTVCVPKPTTDGLFASYLFKLPSVIHLFHRHSQGLVEDTLNLKFHNFARIKVRIPEIPEQCRIAAVFQTADREIQLLERQLELLKLQKKGLMQQLLTGKVRVKP